jgi:predicted transcriptional regulator
MQSDKFLNGVVSRRHVVAAGLAPLIVPRHVLGGPGYQAPSDTLAIAAVGIGGMGRNYLDGCKAEKIVALCDLDHNYAAKVFATYPAARRYHDYREMLDKEARNFDALIIATPDHMHAILLMAAIRMQKHIYCAKPIAHSVGEVRKVRQALLAAKGIVTKGSLSRRERQIMDILYQRGKGSASEVREAMEAAPGYSAVRAMLRVLEEKGHVKHQAEGLKYVYVPVVARDKAKRSAVKHVMETFFNGSAEQIVAALLDVSSTRLTREELDRMSEMIEQAKREGK